MEPVLQKQDACAQGYVLSSERTQGRSAVLVEDALGVFVEGLCFGYELFVENSLLSQGLHSFFDIQIGRARVPGMVPSAYSQQNVREVGKPRHDEIHDGIDALPRVLERGPQHLVVVQRVVQFASDESQSVLDFPPARRLGISLHWAPKIQNVSRPFHLRKWFFSVSSKPGAMSLLFDLLWFFFLFWGVFLHIQYYNQNMEELSEKMFTNREAKRFSGIVKEAFGFSDKLDAVDYVYSKREDIDAFVEFVLNTYLPKASIFSSRYLEVLLYRVGSHDGDSELNALLHTVSRETHMYFMLIVMDMRVHGVVSNASCIRKFYHSFQRFVQISGFKSHVDIVNKIGLIIKQIEESRQSSLTHEARTELEAIHSNCINELKFMCEDDDEYRKVLAHLLAGERYEPSPPHHLLDDTI